MALTKARDLRALLHKPVGSGQLKEVLLLQLSAFGELPAEVQVLPVREVQGEGVLPVGRERVHQVLGLPDGQPGACALILMEKLNIN